MNRPASASARPASSRRYRRSNQPTGRGFEPSNVRMASISVSAKVRSPGGGRPSRYIVRAVQKHHAEQEAQKFLSALLKPNGGFLIFLLPPQGGPGA
jgi:hypothetical protein